MRELAPLNFNVTVLCLQVSRQGKYYVRFISSIRSHALEGTNNIWNLGVGGYGCKGLNILSTYRKKTAGGHACFPLRYASFEAFSTAAWQAPCQ